MLAESLRILEANKRFESQIWQYIDVKLNTVRPEFDNLPICPYAKRYRDSIRVFVANQEMYDVLDWAYRNWNDQETAWVFGFRLDAAPRSQMAEAICDGFADQFYQKNATVLLNHPVSNAPVGGVDTGFDRGVLVIIQRTDLLNDARRSLLKTDYYRNWSDDDKRDLCE